MSLPLGITYVVVGLACGLLATHLRASYSTDAFDVALLCVVWPLYGPLFLLRGQGPRGAGATEPAIERASISLETLLPPEEAAALDRQLARARAKVGDIDGLLGQADFNLEQARWHRERLLKEGQGQAAERVSGRIANIERLHGMRARYSGQLAEIEELLVQTRIQAAVVRLSGWDDESRGLVDTLLSRIDGLEAIIVMDASLAEP